MKILVFPKDSNPYQELLYTKIEDLDKCIQIKYLTGPTGLQSINLILLPALLVFYRIRGYKIFHVHWFFIFRIPSLDFGIFKIIMGYYCIIFMYFSKLLGYKLIWTVHEVISHTAITDKDVSISRNISQRISFIADIKIIHSKVVINEMRGNGLNTDRCFVIPHGSYIGVYPDLATPKKAREMLNIENDDFVILFFGNIREYKGVDKLLEAYSEIDNNKVRLIIAGKCTNKSIIQSIHKFKKTNKIDFYEGYVATEDVAVYFKACDVVCLPFKEITTSGSALLALSFCKPIIAPRIGALIDFPSDVGFLYDPSKSNALFIGITEAISSKKLDRMSESAIRYAETLSWDEIAKKTYRVYESALNL
jgi:beta-1,4-mannosyltransferase